MKYSSVTIFNVLIFLQSTHSAKILGVFPSAGKSLYILCNKLMKGLADTGHDVTVISPYENKLPVLNGTYTDYVLTGFEEDYKKFLAQRNLYEMPEHYKIWEANTYLNLLLSIWNNTLHHPSVKNLLNSKAEFDIVITEYLWNDCLWIFSHIYNCPRIVFTSLGGVNPWVNDQVGNPMPPSYVPHFFMLGDFSQGMTFFQRLHNFMFYAYDLIFKHFLSFPTHNEVLRSAFENPPDVAAMYNNVSLVLLGSHSSLRQPTPMVPNIVEIGGFHIDPPKKLPKELQEFLDSAKYGVIYFSMGSHVESKDFSDEKKTIFLNVFKKLKQKIIWKFEDEVLPGKPDNVLIKKWLPQTDILAHPNVKLFITHGGYGSTLETVYHGVPALMIPVFVDQFNNAFQAVSKGFALKLSYSDRSFNEKTLMVLIQQLLNNSTYAMQAKKVSRLFHDRPMKPLDTAIYWIEYVIRHRGAEHLRTAGVKLPWYKFYMLDVVLFLVIVLFIGIYILYYMLRAIFQKINKFYKQKLH